MKKTLKIKPETVDRLISEAISQRGDTMVLAQYLHILGYNNSKVTVVETRPETSIVQFNNGVRLEVWNKNLF